MQPPTINPCPTCLKFQDFVSSTPVNKVYTSAAQTLTVTCPSGAETTVQLPAGIIGFNLTFELGNPPYPDLVLNCVNGTITVPVPDNTTQPELDMLVNGLLLKCLNQFAINLGCVTGVFFNTQQTLNCTISGFVRSPGAFPAGVSIDNPNRGNNLVMAAGVIQSTLSVADANAKALEVLYEIFRTGNANCSGGTPP